jgi:diaminohydroxyphosphoribosylaminopyrimidine deaminase/5-amino-6-(5-phosphoribosylamino)uracil reductase
MSPELDEQFIRRAIRLAMNGRGRVEPNPMVGCVIVKDGRVIGEGYHAQFGGPHAEPTALANCTESPAGATAYVTLEPCCHTNKKTPPCTPRLIEARIARVVIGCLDPNPDVNGKGVAMLRAAGIHVDGPVLEGAAKQLIAPFLARVRHNRPYVTLKWAESADGKVGGAGRTKLRISNARSSHLVHELRSRSDAILVGVNTVVSDDPQLNARNVDVLRPLLNIVLDTRLRIPHGARLIDDAHRLVVICSQQARDRIVVDDARVLEGRGVEVIGCPTDGPGRLSVPAAIGRLEDFALTHLMVEPGPTLAASFFASGLVDRVWVFRSPNRVDADDAPTAAGLPQSYERVGDLELDGDLLTEYLNPASSVFFAREPSADLVLAQEAATTSSRP